MVPDASTLTRACQSAHEHMPAASLLLGHMLMYAMVRRLYILSVAAWNDLHVTCLSLVQDLS